MKRLTILERHLRDSAARPKECWPYPGYCNKRTGYGNASTSGGPRGSRRVEAHRAAYEMLVGPIPEGLVIDHLCRNRACCNPAHLEPVTHRINLLRGEGRTAREAKQTRCVSGHPLTGENVYLDRRGRRHCIACRNARSRACYHARVGKPMLPLRADRHTHCIRGHPKVAGVRCCQACNTLHQRRYKEERRAAHQDAPPIARL
jgi:hypothetical protein